MDFDLRDWKSIPIRQDNMSRFLGNGKEYFMLLRTKGKWRNTYLER